MIGPVSTYTPQIFGTGSTQGASPFGSTAQTPGSVIEGSFANMVSTAAENTVDRMQQAEQVSVAALQGQADVREVVDAVMSAEQALQAAIAIRDKIVAAYLEISRMAI